MSLLPVVNHQVSCESGIGVHAVVTHGWVHLLHNLLAAAQGCDEGAAGSRSTKSATLRRLGIQRRPFRDVPSPVGAPTGLHRGGLDCVTSRCVTALSAGGTEDSPFSKFLSVSRVSVRLLDPVRVAIYVDSSARRAVRRSVMLCADSLASRTS